MNFLIPKLNVQVVDRNDMMKEMPLGLYYFIDADEYDKDSVITELQRVLNSKQLAGTRAKLVTDLHWNRSSHGFRDYVASRGVNYVGLVGVRGPVIWGNSISSGMRLNNVMVVAYLIRSIMLLYVEQKQLHVQQAAERLEEAIRTCVGERYLCENSITYTIRGLKIDVYGVGSLIGYEYKNELVPLFQINLIDGASYDVNPEIAETIRAVIDESYFDVGKVEVEDEVELPGIVLKKTSDLTEHQLSVRKVVCAALYDGNIVVAGARHYDMVMQTQLEAIRCDGIKRKWKQGFIDQFGVFLDRKEALQVTIASGQPIDYERNGSTKELYSEGLY